MQGVGDALLGREPGAVAGLPAPFGGAYTQQRITFTLRFVAPAGGGPTPNAVILGGVASAWRW